MKVKFEVVARVRYVGETEMTQEQYEQWCQRIDGARGFKRENVAQDLLDAARMDIGDPTDWDDYEVETFESIEESAQSERAEP